MSSTGRYEGGLIRAPTWCFVTCCRSIVENAQLAALEIADGVDPAEMPEMLEAIRVSVTRTAEMLGYLIWHASRGQKD